MGRVALLSCGSCISTAGRSEPNFIAAIAAAAGAAADSISATVSAAFAVGLEATLVLQGGAVLPKLQAGHGRAAAGLLIALVAGRTHLGGGRRVWFANLGAGLCQQSQGTLLSIQLDVDRSGRQRL